MLSPSGWWLVTEPVDLRCGMDRLLVHVQQTLGQDPFGGGAYVFRNRSATRIKVLCCDVHGTWLAVRRLQGSGSSLGWHQPRRFRIVNKLRNGAVANTVHRIVNGFQWDKEPLARLYGLAESILDRQVKLRGRENLVE